MLAGCATPPVALPGLLAGRIAVRVEALGEQPARQLAAAFELQGNDRQGEMRLFGPLGTTLGAARWGPEEAWLVRPDGPAQAHTRYPDLAALSREVLGEAMPLQALADWLAGRPWPGAPSEPAPPGFVQLGWRIDLAGMAEGLVIAMRAAPPAVTVRVRLESPS